MGVRSLHILKRFFKWLLNSFLSGLLTLLPVFATFAVLKWAFGIFYKIWDSFLGKVPVPGIESKDLRAFLSIVVIVLSITLLGALSRVIVVREIIAFFDSILARVPLVKIIYTGTKQILSAIFSSGDRKFYKAVLIEYPRKGIKSIGFLTSKDPMGDGRKVGVFVPTTPNPTSGFYIMVDKEEIEPLEADVLEVFKILVSGGLGMSGLKVGKNDSTLKSSEN